MRWQFITWKPLTLTPISKCEEVYLNELQLCRKISHSIAIASSAEDDLPMVPPSSHRWQHPGHCHQTSPSHCHRVTLIIWWTPTGTVLHFVTPSNMLSILIANNHRISYFIFSTPLIFLFNNLKRKWLGKKVLTFSIITSFNHVMLLLITG